AICAVAAVGVWNNIAQGERDNRYIALATEATDRLFADADHLQLAYFDSVDTTDFDRAFNEARDYALEIGNQQAQQNLVISQDRARSLYASQLKAHSLVEGLFCDTYDTCPGSPHQCRASVTNDDYSIDAAHVAIAQVSNNDVRAALTERMQHLLQLAELDEHAEGSVTGVMGLERTVDAEDENE
ncbi:MAG: hypothetical protein FWC99_07045, partial [Coriobacteriia bacterium]|nr:hypothetical protein [Coriobacteriia bacterium]